MNKITNKKSQNTWQDNIHQHFSRFRRGKYTTRQAEKKLLLNIVQDIVQLSLRVNRFKQLSPSDLVKLTNQWKQRGNTMHTIYKKLAVMKKHYRVNRIDRVISYQDVKAERQKCDSRLYPIVRLSDIENVQLRFLYKGQLLFGLTFKEMLHLKPSLLCEGNIKVLRSFSFNNRERHIVIFSQQQRDWIAGYCKDFKTVWGSCSQISLVRQHRTLCAALSILGEYFRYHYLLWRYHDLLAQYHCISYQQQLAIFAKLRSESGYRSNAPIKEKIQCLSKCYAMPLIVHTN